MKQLEQISCPYCDDTFSPADDKCLAQALKDIAKAEAKLAVVKVRLELVTEEGSSCLAGEAVNDCLDVIDGGTLWKLSPQCRALVDE